MGQILSIEEQPCSTSTEDRILDAALTIIQEKTISGLRIRQVAEKANLFQSNIHYYYNSKKELLLAVQKKVLNRYREIRQQSIHQSGIGPEATLEDRLDIFIKQKIYTICTRYAFGKTKSDCRDCGFFAGGSNGSISGR